MAAKKAAIETLKEICRLAADSSRVRITQTAMYDLMARQFTKADVCDEIIQWINRGDVVKETTLHTFPNLVGMPAYELKLRINGALFYIKMTLVDLGSPSEYMLLISAHPDH